MKRQILVIDDSKAIRFLLRTVLGNKYEVVTASDGFSAMHWLGNQHMPDLIIADPQLPDMHDWELIEHLASSGLYGNIPIFVLSSYSVSETQQRCSEVSIQQFCIKPFNPVDLVKAVDRIITSGSAKQNLVKPMQP